MTRLSEEAGGAVDRLVSNLGGLTKAEGLSVVTDVYPKLIAPFLGAANDLTAQWYSEQKAAPSSTGFVVEPAALPPVDQLAASGRWAVLQSEPATALRGSATRAVFDASRRTVVDNVAREPGARWARHASANACSFCRMLATRGGVYTSAEAAGGVAGRGVDLTVADRRMIAGGLMSRDEAVERRSVYRSEHQAAKYGAAVGDKRVSIGRTRGTRKLGERYHDHCHCIAVMVRPGDVYDPPDYVKQWEQDYIDAVTASKAAGNTTGEHGAIDLKSVLREMDSIERVRVEKRAIGDWLDAEFVHNNAVEYYRRVDDELAKPFGGKADAPAKPKRGRKPKRTLDDVERDMGAALEAGDDALVDKLASEMERIERREQAAAAKAAEREAAKQAKAAAAEAELRAKHDRIFELIEAGEDPDVAEAEVMGVSLDSVRRRNFMRDAQAEGHAGDTFTKVLKQKYYALVNEAYQAAENATRGVMIKRKFDGKIDPTSLWSMSERDARKYMSEEMAAWFDQHGRLTFMAYRQSVLDGTTHWRNPMTEDYLQ
ncbi:MuF-like minor capsid protein [Mycobacterium phage Omnicron]|uniref:MuF-like minor capsid protein n=1 Tax=Mycobacterium phage Omnicron TaxID=1541819 RepID=A0A088FUW7_9CAUD|nr:head maturation protease [Mycobacterium phage Omnicron]AIM50341.1 MuF-like minor capsid protein [Mycobacterium phage Omnicron]